MTNLGSALFARTGESESSAGGAFFKPDAYPYLSLSAGASYKASAALTSRGRCSRTPAPPPPPWPRPAEGGG